MEEGRKMSLLANEPFELMVTSSFNRDMAPCWFIEKRRNDR